VILDGTNATGAASIEEAAPEPAQSPQTIKRRSKQDPEPEQEPAE
jgi:hypothetical protein